MKFQNALQVQQRSTTPRTIGRRTKLKKSSIFACAVFYLCLNLKTRVCTKFNSVAKVTPFPSMTYSGRNKFEVSHRSPTTLFVFSSGQKQLTCYRCCYFFVLYYVSRTIIKYYTHHIPIITDEIEIVTIIVLSLFLYVFNLSECFLRVMFFVLRSAMFIALIN